MALSHPTACSAHQHRRDCPAAGQELCPTPWGHDTWQGTGSPQTQPCPQAPGIRAMVHWSPWQGWPWPPSSKNPPEKPKILQPSAKCLFRTHR